MKVEIEIRENGIENYKEILKKIKEEKVRLVEERTRKIQHKIIESCMTCSDTGKLLADLTCICEIVKKSIHKQEEKKHSDYQETENELKELIHIALEYCDIETFRKIIFHNVAYTHDYLKKITKED